MTAGQLKAIAKIGGFDTYSDHVYHLASIGIDHANKPYTETWTDGHDDADEVGAEWRRQMEKD